MSEKNKTKKNRKVKNLYTEEEIVGSVRKIYQTKGQQYLLHVWKTGGGQWYSLWALYTKECGWTLSILPRGKLSRTVLQLQHKSGRESVHIWTEIRGANSKRPLPFKEKKR